MGIGVLLESILSALSVGTGCGTCCGSSAGVLLSTYIMTHTDSIKKSLLSFVTFYAGKILAVVMLCVVCSLFGANVLAEVPFFSSDWMERAVSLIMIGMGVYFIIKWFAEQKGHKHCKAAEKGAGRNKKRTLPLFVAGLAYGISPCAPLILIAGLCITLPIHYAIITGAVFALSSAISPMLLVLLLTGVLTPNMHKEIPGMIKWLRLACYIGVVCFFAYDMLHTFA